MENPEAVRGKWAFTPSLRLAENLQGHHGVAEARQVLVSRAADRTVGQARTTGRLLAGRTIVTPDDQHASRDSAGRERSHFAVRAKGESYGDLTTDVRWQSASTPGEFGAACPSLFLAPVLALERRRNDVPETALRNKDAAFGTDK